MEEGTLQEEEEEEEEKGSSPDRMMTVITSAPTAYDTSVKALSRIIGHVTSFAYEL